MPIKTTMMPYSSVRIVAIIKKTTKNCYGECEEREPGRNSLLEQIGAAAMENSMEASQKSKIELLYDLAISLLCILQKENPKH